MTNEEAINTLKSKMDGHTDTSYEWAETVRMAIKALEQRFIDKSAMMYEIYMKGVNMSGEYQGCWVRFKDIENIVDKYIAESEE